MAISERDKATILAARPIIVGVAALLIYLVRLHNGTDSPDDAFTRAGKLFALWQKELK